MTYCVGMMLDRGLVFMSDSRSNGGMDYVSTFKKLYSWKLSDDRLITILCSGNLGTTQAVINDLDERVNGKNLSGDGLLQCKTMFQVAKIVARSLKETIQEARGPETDGNSTFDATLILGGQILGERPRLFQIYPEGNFIEASETSPFFQIGETKYGRPILLRGFDRGMSFSHSMKLMLVSFDSTMKTNLTVSPPFHYQLFPCDQIDNAVEGIISEDDPNLKMISEGWGDALKQALDQLPNFVIPGSQSDLFEALRSSHNE
ncbi:MAG: peptidase [Burkholderiales bacterium]|nr:peptidase [Burkholderiales bacterium]